MGSDIYLELAKANLTAREIQVMLVLIDIGITQIPFSVSLSDLGKAVRQSRQHAWRSINSLLQKGLVAKVGYRADVKYRVVTNYKLWDLLKKPSKTVAKVGYTKVIATTPPPPAKVKKPRKPRAEYKYTDVDVYLTEKLIELMKENDPKTPALDKLQNGRLRSWYDACRKLREINHRTPEEIEAVIIFSQKDSFWCNNILSMTKLREKFPQLWLKAKGRHPSSKYRGVREWLNENKEGE
uniref:Uncharacterized protein n=1 Tax=viral metagenome TaxID=1070528 RepID=A0A6M3IFX1_9ZZZZ